MSVFRKAALALAAKGLRVFPCIERGKEPAIHDNLKRATTNPNVISGWWGQRDFNIGIATGEESGIWVLDSDGDEHETIIRQFEAEHGPLPETVEVITGGGGRHLYFRWPTGREIRNKQDRPDLPDVRGNGGFVIAPPSIHPSGRVYAWSVDSGKEFAEAPEWLLDLVTKPGRATGKAGNPTASTQDIWRTFVDERHNGSHRSSAISRLVGYLLRKYVDPLLALSIARMFNTLQCDEPLADSELVRIVGNIKRLEDARRAERDAP